MVRFTLILLVSFLACVVSLTGCRPRTLHAQRGKAAAIAVDKAPQKGKTWTVKGWGRNQQEAEEDAVKEASATLADFLKKQQPPLTAAPSPAYVRKHMIHEPAR